MNPIEEHINYYQHFAPNPTAFRESLENALVYAKNANKNLNMDLRDYFAAKALPSCISAWIDSQDKCNEAVYFSIEHKTTDAQIVAEDAYGIADAMMKAREE